MLYMAEKIQKNIAFPDWIARKYDEESDLLGKKMGSILASAAILLFCDATPETKKAYVKRVQDQHLNDVYGPCPPSINTTAKPSLSDEELAEKIVSKHRPEAIALARTLRKSRK